MSRLRNPWTGEFVDTGSETPLDIQVLSGVNIEGKPFCSVQINNGALQGQMTPDELRGMALQWMQVAADAEADALLFRFFSEEIGLEFQQTGSLLVRMREFRDKNQEKP